MRQEQGTSADLAGLVVPVVGGLMKTGEVLEPYRLLDAEGVSVEPVAVYFRELQAADRSVATIRSYGMDLLRWFRFLWAAGVCWDRASSAQARDFARWLQLGAQDRAPYSRSVRAHGETVLRGFYDYRRDEGTGPVLNPFPLDRIRGFREIDPPPPWLCPSISPGRT